MAYSKLAKGMKRITVLPGKEFRGVKYFEATSFDASESLANMYIESGDAILHECQK